MFNNDDTFCPDFQILLVVSFLKDKPILLDIEITWYNVFVTERRGAAEGTGELIESWVCRIETSAL